MCGIAGTFSVAPQAHRAPEVLKVLRHRGPDSAGHQALNDGRLHLYHVRLSIQDLSPAGHQPMSSACGRYTVIFNGEIYNFRELADELRRQGKVLRGHSDTEVLVEYLSIHGPQRTLAAMSGMFAFAAFDNHSQELMLARDRLGEKPLYWGLLGDTLFFSSEIKGLFAAGMERPPVDEESLWLFFRYGYVPQPRSMFSKVSKVEPGCWLTFKIDTGHVECVSMQRYWSAMDVAQAAMQSEERVTRASQLQALEGLLERSVRQQSVADVEVGVFLSGGVDSSLVAALLCGVTPQKVKSFTVAFQDAAFDESAFARDIAAYLGTDHHEIQVGDDELLKLVDLLPEIYDEPIANASQLPAILLSRFAAEHVKVCLSGDGGDELFGGYNRYTWGAKVDGYRTLMTPPLARQLGKVAELCAGSRVVTAAARKLAGGPVQDISSKLRKLGGALQHVSTGELYDYLISNWMEPPIQGVAADVTGLDAGDALSFRRRAMLLDQMYYLPGDNLAKVDRASMSASLEVRLPLLSHELIEFAWRIPEVEHFRGTSKSMLREVLYKRVPRSLIERPKMGFTVPLAQWLRGQLKEWGEDLLGSRSLYGELPFDMDLVAKEWRALQQGHDASAWRIWAVLSFLSWRARWAG